MLFYSYISITVGFRGTFSKKGRCQINPTPYPTGTATERRKTLLFRDVMMTPYSAYMTEAARSSETLRLLYHTRRRYIEIRIGLYESSWEDEVFISWYHPVYLSEFWGRIFREVSPASFTFCLNPYLC